MSNRAQISLHVVENCRVHKRKRRVKSRKGTSTQKLFLMELQVSLDEQFEPYWRVGFKVFMKNMLKSQAVQCHPIFFMDFFDNFIKFDFKVVNLIFGGANLYQQ